MATERCNNFFLTVLLFLAFRRISNIAYYLCIFFRETIFHAKQREKDFQQYVNHSTFPAFKNPRADIKHGAQKNPQGSLDGARKKSWATFILYISKS